MRTPFGKRSLSCRRVPIHPLYSRFPTAYNQCCRCELCSNIVDSLEYPHDERFNTLAFIKLMSYAHMDLFLSLPSSSKHGSAPYLCTYSNTANLFRPSLALLRLHAVHAKSSSQRGKQICPPVDPPRFSYVASQQPSYLYIQLIIYSHPSPLPSVKRYQLQARTFSAVLHAYLILISSSRMRSTLPRVSLP